MAHAAGMVPTISSSIPVVDFRRQSMVLQWNEVGGTWTAYDEPPPLVQGVALIRASQPNICLFARDNILNLQVGRDQFSFTGDLPRIKWGPDLVTLGVRRRFSVESRAGVRLFTKAFWMGQGEDFFSWLALRTNDPGWRASVSRRWSAGVEPAVVRAS